eukprot:CAMPEP_0184874654 /NCGR_PEP_ID=MMETSP0580-20130426/42522_1 /TAXON_ID=1118495 /ORGANISM="Dactyliosolen fragilissimus" /LENGTH=916 /DNA_ID=CAMNT_0027377707 /DNA_START=1222 /DNA_END=3972 /DNA_ORIENTATION=+
MQEGSEKLGTIHMSKLGPQPQEAPWTVLVSEMRLLWTLDIRDRALSIVQDLYFAINFMKVNSRGTHHLMSKNQDYSRGESDLKGQQQKKESKCTEEDLRKGNEYNCEEGAIETICCSNNQNINNVHIVPINMDASQINSSKLKKSHLDYLLEENASDQGNIDLQRRPKSPEGFDRVTETALLSAVSFDSLDSNESKADDIVSRNHIVKNEIDTFYSETDSIPTFDVYLSNPQIQLHSESTGGSLILAVDCAVIEGKKFVSLLSKDKNDFSLENFLRRTAFQYALERMEIFSLDSNIEVENQLQWLETAAININEQEGNGHKFIPLLQNYDIKNFLIPHLMKQIMSKSTFRAKQVCLNTPIDLTKEELEDQINNGQIISMHNVDDDGSTSSVYALDRIEMTIDELSFLLDSHQFTTTLDLIRNVLLASPKPTRQRFYNSSQIAHNNDIKTEDNPEEIVDMNNKSPPIEDFKNVMLKKDGNPKLFERKRGREDLLFFAQSMLNDFNDQQDKEVDQNLRKVEYTLSKAKWKVKSNKFNDQVEINFTGFKGKHDFSADGSVNSHISLEDVFVSSQNPGSDAMNSFFDATSIIKTIIGVERSPCSLCGKEFHRSSNESNSCKFHSGSFVQVDKIYRWTCCKAMWKDAPGCASGPHSGKELAMDLRLEALPKVVEGITMYNHIEANIFPGVPHTIIVQLTKSLVELLSNYFLDDEDKNVKITNFQIEKLSDSTDMDKDTSLQELHEEGNTRNSLDDDNLYGKKEVLFGASFPAENCNDSVRKQKEVNATIASGERNTSKNQVGKKNEFIFVNIWRLGEINVNVSIAGYHKIANISNLGLTVPSFRKAYKIGTSNELIRLLIFHLVKSLASCGLGIIRNKIAGKGHESPDSSSQTEDNAADLLLGAPLVLSKTKRKKKWSKST